MAEGIEPSPANARSQTHTPLRKRLIIVIASAAILLGLLVGFHLFKTYMIHKALQKNVAPTQTVSAAPAEYSNWQPHIDSVGSLRAVRGVDVTTEVGGLVRAIHFKSGDEVNDGQVLVELIDDADVAQLHALQASARLQEITYKRDQAQFAAQGISREKLDTDAANLKNARAQVNAQAAIVARKTLRAPFAGRLGITTVNAGQYLSPGQKVVTLQTIDPIYADFSLPQQDLVRVSPGQTVHITTDAFPGRTFKGKVTALEPRIDASTRNFQIEALVENPKHVLMPGLFVRAAVLTGETRPYLTLPKTAIAYNPYGATVFVVRKPRAAGAPRTVQETFVVLGETRGDQVAVLRGIHGNDLVVTSGQLKLKNGTPVTIDNSVAPPSQAHPTLDAEIREGA